MKKVLLPLLGILLMAGCEKESNTPAGPEADQALDLRAGKVTVCHQTGSGTNPYEIIEIADQAWTKAHKKHGDFLLPTWYADADGDGFGDAATSTTDCVQPEGYVADNTDCDDTKDTVYPGAAEICGDGLDNDCDEAIDEDCVVTPEICDTYEGGIVFYLDGNGGGLVAANVDQGTSTWDAASSLIADLNSSDPNYDDWRLPTPAELNLMWENLADRDGNDSNSGPDDEYNCGGFASTFYWSSIDNGPLALVQAFYDGHQEDELKNSDYSVRAVRAF